MFLNERQKGPKASQVSHPKAVRLEKKLQLLVIYMDTLKKNTERCQMSAFSLSADRTLKVSSNIGFWCDGKWIQLYDSLFIS